MAAPAPTPVPVAYPEVVATPVVVPPVVAAAPVVKDPMYAVPVPPLGGRQWSAGLCDCMTDPGLCCLTCWCPCITSGRITDILDEGQTFNCMMGGLIYCAMGAVGLNTCYSCIWRTTMREKYGINPQNSNFHDFCIHLWCEGCALCQEYKELQAMGINPSLGYQGIVALQQVPPNQQMVRV